MNKKLYGAFLLGIVCFLIILPWLAIGDTGDPTIARSEQRGELKSYSWTMAEDMNGKWDSGTSILMTGKIVSIKHEPVSGITPFNGSADVVLTDAQGNDILMGLGTDLNTSAGATTYQVPVISGASGFPVYLMNETVGLGLTSGSGVSAQGFYTVVLEH